MPGVPSEICRPIAFLPRLSGLEMRSTCLEELLSSNPSIQPDPAALQKQPPKALWFLIRPNLKKDGVNSRLIRVRHAGDFLLRPTVHLFGCWVVVFKEALPIR